jgi:hypothetical protein
MVCGPAGQPTTFSSSSHTPWLAVTPLKARWPWNEHGAACFPAAGPLPGGVAAAPVAAPAPNEVVLLQPGVSHRMSRGKSKTKAAAGGTEGLTDGAHNQRHHSSSLNSRWAYCSPMQANQALEGSAACLRAFPTADGTDLSPVSLYVLLQTRTGHCSCTCNMRACFPMGLVVCACTAVGLRMFKRRSLALSEVNATCALTCLCLTVCPADKHAARHSP